MENIEPRDDWRSKAATYADLLIVARALAEAVVASNRVIPTEDETEARELARGLIRRMKELGR